MSEPGTALLPIHEYLVAIRAFLCQKSAGGGDLALLFGKIAGFRINKIHIEAKRR